MWEILKDKVADEHFTSAENLKMAIRRIRTKKILQLNSANTWCIAYLVVYKLLSRTKVDIQNTRFFEENWLFKLMSLLFGSGLFSMYGYFIAVL